MMYVFIGCLGILMTPLGAFLLWKRWTFLGDSLAHCALLGAALGVMLGVPWIITYGCIALMVSVSLIFHPHEQWLSLVSYGAVPLGLLCFSFLPKIYINPKDVLFGDPEHISMQDWCVLVILAAVVIFFVKCYWSKWLFATLNRDLAIVEGIAVKRLEYVFVILVTGSLGLCMKSVGQLLAPGLIVMPAMAASYLARTPENLIQKAVVIVTANVILSCLLSKVLCVAFSPLLLSLLFIEIILLKCFCAHRKITSAV